MRSKPSSWSSTLHEETEDNILVERKKTGAQYVNVLEDPGYSPKKCRVSTYDSIVRVQIRGVGFWKSVKDKCFHWDRQPSVTMFGRAERKIIYQVQRFVEWDLKSFLVIVSRFRRYLYFEDDAYFNRG